MRRGRGGFTLLEIMITLVLALLAMGAVYRTFHTVYFVAAGVDTAMERSGADFLFVRTFSEELAAAIPDTATFRPAADSLEFLCLRGRDPYPVRIVYKTAPATDGSVELWKLTENVLSGTRTAYPVLTGLQRCFFTYRNAGGWLDSWDPEELPVAAAVTLVRGDAESFHPVMLPGKP